jgi:hypothetical protein
MSVLAAKHLDKGDDIESQYYKYKDNIMQNEKNMNHNYMRCLSFFFNCCSCFYKPTTIKRITDNRELEKTIKFSKIENSEKYKRRAYQYTLSSIMLNNVKNECIEVKMQQQVASLKDTATQVEDALGVEEEKDRSVVSNAVASVVTSVVSTTSATLAKVKDIRKKKDSEEKGTEKEEEKGNV